MIDPAVLAAAMAFWAPFSPPAGACPGGVVAHERATPPSYLYVKGTTVMAWAQQGSGNCEIWTTRDFAAQSRAQQCAYVVHEIGHARFNLGHAASGIMKALDPPIPGICYVRRAVAAKR